MRGWSGFLVCEGVGQVVWFVRCVSDLSESLKLGLLSQAQRCRCHAWSHQDHRNVSVDTG